MHNAANLYLPIHSEIWASVLSKLLRPIAEMVGDLQAGMREDIDLGLEIFDPFLRALRVSTKADHSNHMGKGEVVSTWSTSFLEAFCGFSLAIAILLSSMEILCQDPVVTVM
jgi:hypothetical protein